MATAVPNIMIDPGLLYWAPLATAEPTNTVVGSVFTDSWPAGWISLGATEDGTDFDWTVKMAPIMVAEFLDPVLYRTTDRSGSVGFSLADWTMKSMTRAFNGGTLTTVSGATSTLLTSLTPPAAGSEVRAMLGWESLDHTARFVYYQCVNGGDIKQSFKKAPKIAALPCVFNLELPTSGFPWKMYGAGVTRLGT